MSKPNNNQQSAPLGRSGVQTAQMLGAMGRFNTECDRDSPVVGSQGRLPPPPGCWPFLFSATLFILQNIDMKQLHFLLCLATQTTRREGCFKSYRSTWRFTCALIRYNYVCVTSHCCARWLILSIDDTCTRFSK